jgi:hypothetical protein
MGTSKIITLTGSLRPLRERFNGDRHKLRLIAVLSPT